MALRTGPIDVPSGVDFRINGCEIGCGARRCIPESVARKAVWRPWQGDLKQFFSVK